MKRNLILLVVSLVAHGYAHAQDVRQLLQDAIAAPAAGPVERMTPTGEHRWTAVTDREYATARDRIVGMGQTAVPELQAIIAGADSSWEERITAGICLERIRHGDAIREVVTRNWMDDPNVAADPRVNSRLGPVGAAESFMRQRFKDGGLHYHLLQLVWKRTGEHPPFGHSWDIWAAKVLEETGHADLIHIARERTRQIQDPRNISGDWFYIYLVRMKDHDSLSRLFDLWLQYRELDWPLSFRMCLRYHPGEEERCRKSATESSTSWLRDLLPIATATDAAWIAEKLQGIELGSAAQIALNAYLQRVGDTTPPVITVSGPNPVSILCGGAFIDAGATATDNKDGDLTGSITTTCTVNTDTVGTHTMTYAVKDAAGNEATATRTVQVLYNFTGFMAPIGGADTTGGTVQAPVKTFKAGSKIPVKFTIGCGIGLIHEGVHTLQVVKWNDETTAAEPIDASPADAATTGNQFRWAEDHWQYILDTKSMNMGVGVWELRATLSDGSKHSVFIGLK
jgi:hypothetical protein